jgi:hypothetical protein
LWHYGYRHRGAAEALDGAVQGPPAEAVYQTPNFGVRKLLLPGIPRIGDLMEYSYEDQMN